MTTKEDLQNQIFRELGAKSELLEVSDRIADIAEQHANERVKESWISVEDELPTSAMGSYIACLENNVVMEINYSDITKKWWVIGLGPTDDNNPVTHWMEKPKGAHKEED